jgi:protein-L-isoaspartate O-methyltransferase
MVIPVGARDGVQQLLLIRKASDGKTIVRQTIDVRFVPLTRAR